MNVLVNVSAEVTPSNAESQCVGRGNTIKCRDLLPDPKVYFTEDIKYIMLLNIPLSSNKMFSNTPNLQDLVLSDCHFPSGDIRSSMFAGITFLGGLTIFKFNANSVKPNAFRQVKKMRSILLKEVTIVSIIVVLI